MESTEIMAATKRGRVPTITCFEDMVPGVVVSVRERPRRPIRYDMWCEPKAGVILWFQRSDKYKIWMLGLLSPFTGEKITTVAPIARVKPGSFFSSKREARRLHSIYRVKAIDPSIDSMMTRSMSGEQFRKHLDYLEREFFDFLAIHPSTIPEICAYFNEPRTRVARVIHRMLNDKRIAGHIRHTGGRGKPAIEYSLPILLSDIDIESQQ